ncbi:H/ACA ribonucleoprotein complex non-core subunit NAF1-like [Anopheles ziemanni]|uniref:H/ACA ribonucleoprotein complex non-core subunit NAF1 n=1 Tax=Anopheles coustani TaxID=139045 RepID=UPI002657B1A7|nr:H/ACA ribonucleoprotein complex non-core subunit NAF1 [Anopheles coustani]XP_058170784.1 H/ACA ribonucleoprotein complex non-core subunit NAF1-like [Anopheles ziemanni]
MEDTKPEDIANGDPNASISVPHGESVACSKGVDTKEESVAESSINDSPSETFQKDSTAPDTSEAKAGHTELAAELKKSDISEPIEQPRGEQESTSVEAEPACPPVEERQTVVDSTAKETPAASTEVSKTAMDVGEPAESVPTTEAATVVQEMEGATSVTASDVPPQPIKDSGDENLSKDPGSENIVVAADAATSTMEVEESAGNDVSTIAIQEKNASTETVNEPVKETEGKTLDGEKVHPPLAGSSSETASNPATGATETSEVASANLMEVEGPAENVASSVSIQDEIAEQQQLETEAVKNINKNSLSLLCQYSGSSESESEDTDGSKAVDNRKQSSPSSSSSDESEDEAADTGLSSSYRKCTDTILISDAETMDTNAVSSDDDDEDLQNQAPIRTKGEILVDELPPIEELTITVPETECKPIGLIDSIVAQIVLVQSIPGVELLNLETVLFLDRGKRPLGKIFDVIGQVNCPIYCVLFNTNQEVVSKNITVGMQVYCAPRTEHTSFIILSELMRYKGSDASWMNDNEPPPHMVEYSDDEAEKTAKRNRKKKANANGERDGENSQQSPQYHHQQQYHQQQQHHHHQQQQQQQQQFQRPHMGPRPQFRRPPPNNRGHFNPQQRSGYSWHHNVNNPRYQNPQQHHQQQQFPQHQQQQFPQHQQQQFPQHQQQYPQHQQQYPQHQQQHPQHQQQYPQPHQQHQQQFLPHQQQQQHPPQQQMQQFPNAQPGTGPAYLPNPFAMFGPHQPPNQ